MKVGLLLCYHVQPEYRVTWGDYDEMFARLFAGHPELSFRIYDVVNGELPLATDECDGWITSGSRYSVNDDEPWIGRLEEFVRRIAADGVPFVGICFGHQLIAKALGGEVVRSERGWGVGIKEVEVAADVEWMTPAVPRFRILNLHEDQVEKLPPGAVVLGWNEHCPVSMMEMGGTLLGIQGHPEMDPGYVGATSVSRRGALIPEQVVDAGLESLAQPADSGLIADWIVSFLKNARR